LTSRCGPEIGPSGATSTPPGFSCEVNGSSSDGIAAFTKMPSNGARSFQPSAPSLAFCSMSFRPSSLNASLLFHNSQGSCSTVQTFAPSAATRQVM
jgi:hypothetical protein